MDILIGVTRIAVGCALFGFIGSQLLMSVAFYTNEERAQLIEAWIPFGLVCGTEVYERVFGFRWFPLYWACWITRGGLAASAILYPLASLLAGEWVSFK